MVSIPFVFSPSILSNIPTNLCMALYCILLCCFVLYCIVLLIYCYVDIIQYNAKHKFVGVQGKLKFLLRFGFNVSLFYFVYTRRNSGCVGDN